MYAEKNIFTVFLISSIFFVTKFITFYMNPLETYITFNSMMVFGYNFVTYSTLVTVFALKDVFWVFLIVFVFFNCYFITRDVNPSITFVA